MGQIFKSKYRLVTISGKIAAGTTTLTDNLADTLGWKHINIGSIQRKYHQKHMIHENKTGAMSRDEEHEKKIDNITKEVLKTEKEIIYEGWLTGFFAQSYPDILKVLLVCSHDDIRVDRVANRDNITVEEAKNWIKNREKENITKWKELYGNHDFWNPKYFDLVIDTYETGPIETLGMVFDKIGYE